MLSKRYDAASLIIRDEYLWVSGGNDGINTLFSSEFIDIDTKGIYNRSAQIIHPDYYLHGD